MFLRSIISVVFFVVLASNGLCQEHRVESADGVSDAEGVGAEILAELSPQGMRIVRGESRTVCTIWTVKLLEVPADFKPTPVRLYPFQPGQLMGVVQLPRRTEDFRGQQISKGWYTLRYALQPVDGNHVGTSPTQDFLVLIKAEDDPQPAALDVETLTERSAAAAGSTHPAMLCLQPVAPHAGNKTVMLHDEGHDWWKLHFEANTKSGDVAQKQPVDVVVVGKAEE
ncbi:MAG: hypothetical protein KDA60_05850 [Planctomycetales bacterium]|nr:hypothetical protein [Planctomycetales bacterium]